jgi:hypothetical protein
MKHDIEKTLENWARSRFEGEALRYRDAGTEIPDYMVHGLKHYVLDGVLPGGFLKNVLMNDLVGAVAHADRHNTRNLTAYASWMYNFCPSEAWGSDKKVYAWAKRGGMRGVVKERYKEEVAA